jgi:hypothetical protein
LRTSFASRSRYRFIMRRGAVIACVGFFAAVLVACLGYEDPVDDSADPAAPLPERTTLADGSVADSSSLPSPDASKDATAATDSADAAKTMFRVFVTSTTPTGNLGGVAGADALCNQLATAAKLGGTYRAWLSVSGADAIDHITSTGPWHLVTGELVAPNKTMLTGANLKHLIDKDEKGATPPLAEDRTWTGTGANGRYVGPDCAQWTGAGSGLVGEARNPTTGKWTALVAEACTEVNRVYCFEL